MSSEKLHCDVCSYSLADGGRTVAGQLFEHILRAHSADLGPSAVRLHGLLKARKAQAARKRLVLAKTSAPKLHGRCDDCSFATTAFSRGGLNVHLKVHILLTHARQGLAYERLRETWGRFRANRRSLTCDECEAVFASVEGLSGHLIASHKAKLRPRSFHMRTLGCDDCGKLIRGTMRRMAHHWDHSHRHKRQIAGRSNNTRRCCETCGKSFPFLKFFAHWLRFHCARFAHQSQCRPSRARSAEVPVTCDLCSESLGNKSVVALHVGRVHGLGLRKPEPLREERVCEDCGQALSGSEAMSYHWQLRHAGAAVREAARRQRRRHSAVRVVCDLCPKVLRSKKGLAKHLASKTLPLC